MHRRPKGEEEDEGGKAIPRAGERQRAPLSLAAAA